MGFDLLREIRSNSDVPVIITTGAPAGGNRPRGSVSSSVADDYVTKPFGLLRELLARVSGRSAGGTSWGGLARAREPQRGGYKFGDWQLETQPPPPDRSEWRCR